MHREQSVVTVWSHVVLDIKVQFHKPAANLHKVIEALCEAKTTKNSCKESTIKYPVMKFF